MKYLFLFLCLLGIAPVNAAELSIGDKAHYNVTIAVTPEELEKGLMFVRQLPDDEGKLFDLRGFRGKRTAMWMKNTYIALDMVFIGCDWTITDIYKNAQPMSLELIQSETDYCYVLEINGGQADLKKLSYGDKVLYPGENKAMLKQ